MCGTSYFGMNCSECYVKSKRSLVDTLIDELKMDYNSEENTYSLKGKKFDAYVFKQNPLGQLDLRFYQDSQMIKKVHEICVDFEKHRRLEVARYTAKAIKGTFI